MRILMKEILAAFLMGMVVPGLVLNLAAAALERPAALETEETVQATEAAQTVALPALVRMLDGTVKEMDMDTYITGVVLAEMPAYFEEEALKAQAVVARTYARKAYVHGGKHGDGSVCTRSSCCQAYRSEADYLEEGGTQESADRIRSAVLATSGYVLTYGGVLIEATYFSCSGGSTEDAEAVWGADFPYLQAVDSPGEEEAAYYTDTVTFTAERFRTLLGAELNGSPENWFGEATYTAGGGVATMLIGEQSYQGTRLRSLLGLRSTAFEIAAEGQTITVTTHGYGHRVGMSQYGADAMAVTGSTYQEILAHYYQGTQLSWLGMEGQEETESS